MEHRTNESSDDQRQEFSRDSENREEDRDAQVEMMNRDKREAALAWAHAYRLIRGGVDEVVEMIVGSQYTIEVLLQILRNAACRQCELGPQPAAEDCAFCRHRDELLERLA